MLMQLGFKLYDALYLAFAQSASADIFLTTADLLLRKAKQYSEIVTIPVENPVVWLMELLQEENTDHETSRNQKKWLQSSDRFAWSRWHVALSSITRSWQRRLHAGAVSSQRIHPRRISTIY